MNYTPEQLKNLRERLELTQEQMGECIGVSKTQVYRMEAGDRPITKTMAILLGMLESN